MTEREIELQAKLEQAERERDATQSLALRKCVELTDRATAAESALAAAQGALREALRWCPRCHGNGRYDQYVALGVDSGGGAWARRRWRYEPHDPCEACSVARAALAAESGKPALAECNARHCECACHYAAESGKPGGEAPHPRHSCLECHGDCPTPDLCAEGAKRAPALPAELSGKGEVEKALRGYLGAHKKRRNATETSPCECYLCDDARIALGEQAEPGEAKKEEGRDG